jgi:hypothetical protein
MRRSHSIVIAAATVFAALALPVRAHHSLEDTFDQSRTVTLRGVVRKVEWANPHVRLLVEVKGTTAEIATWMVEIKPPRAMERIGVRAATLSQVEISVDVWPAKDGSLSASGRTLRMPDGAVYDVSSKLDWRRFSGW